MIEREYIVQRDLSQHATRVAPVHNRQNVQIRLPQIMKDQVRRLIGKQQWGLCRLRRTAGRASAGRPRQGLRDLFGAHTYRRTDRDGVFHTLWAQDRSEETR